jgi:hypothetical protein
MPRSFRADSRSFAVQKLRVRFQLFSFPPFTFTLTSSIRAASRLNNPVSDFCRWPSCQESRHDVFPTSPLIRYSRYFAPIRGQPPLFAFVFFVCFVVHQNSFGCGSAAPGVSWAKNPRSGFSNLKFAICHPAQLVASPNNSHLTNTDRDT